MNKLFFSLVFVFMAPAVHASSVVADIQKSFASVNALKADFIQVVKSSRFGEKKSEGKLSLQRPGKMIWKYSEPKGRIFVADGDTVSLFDPVENQILMSPQPSTNLPAGLSFLMGQNDLETEFKVQVTQDQKNTKGQREVALLCKPKKQNPEFIEMELHFRFAEKVTITKSVIVDLLGTRNEISFRDMKINPSISPKEFQPAFPKSAPIVVVDAL